METKRALGTLALSLAFAYGAFGQAAQVVSTASAQPAAAAASSTAPANSSSVAPASSADQTQATVYFYRARRFQGSALKPSVYVDDAAVGRLHNGDVVKVDVAPGSHRVYSNDKSTGMDLDAKAGQTYYIRIDIQLGFLKGHGGVTLVDPQQGTYEVGQLKGKSDSQ